MPATAAPLADEHTLPSPAHRPAGTAPRPGRVLSTRSELHLVVVPTAQPPLAEDLRAVQPVDLGRPSPRPAYRPGPPPRLDHSGAHLDADFGPRRSVRSELPDPAALGRRLVVAAVEVLAGLRPLTQLAEMTSPGVLSALASGRRPGWCQDTRGPLLVGGVRVCEPVDGVAEIAAVARRAGRAHAIAARLEGVDGRWQCTALRIG